MHAMKNIAILTLLVLIIYTSGMSLNANLMDGLKRPGISIEHPREALFDHYRTGGSRIVADAA